MKNVKKLDFFLWESYVRGGWRNSRRIGIMDSKVSSFVAQVIVGAGADVTVRARGTFFHPADQQNSCPPEESNYEVT